MRTREPVDVAPVRRKSLRVQRTVAVLLAALLVAAVPLAASPAQAGAAKAKRVLRCPLPKKPKRACPPLRGIAPIGKRGGISRAAALKVFATKVARVPGVKPRRGGYPYIRSASGPIQWVLRHWRKLKPAQKRAVRRALPGIRVPGARKRVQVRPRATSAQLQALQQIADKGTQLLDKFISPDLSIAVHVDIDKVWKEVDAGAYAEAKGGCRIAFPPGTDPGDQYTKELMLHELTHCYAFQLSPDSDSLPPWVMEGSAQWVQGVVSKYWLGSGYVSEVARNEWKAYFKNFTAPLTQHSYSAMPYYAHLGHSYGQEQVFQTITKMFDSPPKDAYKIFTAGNPIRLLDTLAPSGTRLGSLGESWATSGAHIPPVDKARYNPPSIAVGAGTVKLDTGAFRRTVVGLNAAKGAQAVKLDVGSAGSAWGLLHREQGDHRLQDGDTYVCVGKQCSCPDGHEVPRLGDDGYLAVYAHRELAKVRLKGAKLEEACNQNPSAMVVSGAFNMTVTERGSCGLKASEMGSQPLDALFATGFSPSRPQGLGGVHLQVSGAGPGTYPSEVNKPGPQGSGQVTRFGEPGGAVWSNYSPIGQEPPITKFGVITVSSVTSGGATGTVNMVLYSSPPSSLTKVSLKGRWSCTPFDTQLGANPPARGA